MDTPTSWHSLDTTISPKSQSSSQFPRIVGIISLLVLSAIATTLLAETPSSNGIAERAKAAWLDGSTNRALDILNHAIREQAQAHHLQKLRGDILATSRRHQEAIEAYDVVLHHDPKNLQVRWAKWSVLLRSGQSDQAVAEFQGIAQQDTENPLVQLRLAQELRKLDRLEESLEWYKKAVALKPEMPGWRLAMARAEFDILNARGARDEVKRVLKMVEPGSPEELAARNLLSVVYGATKERGRRYEYVFSPEGTAADRKEWASMRADAWRLFEAGRYQEAEPLYRRILELKPSDFAATHELGLTLIALDRCNEAIQILDGMHTLNPSDEVYADTIYRMARCQMKSQKWTEALVYLEVLYEAAVEFEEAAKDASPEPGQRYLNKEMLAKLIEQVQQHLPGNVSLTDKANEEIPHVEPTSEAAMAEEEYYLKLAREKLGPQQQIPPRASLMGRDADFSVFRYVIPANQVLRDNLPMGTHEFIPINPGDTYSTDQQEIYLVFGLVNPSYDEVMLTAECFLETSKITPDELPLTQDQIIMGMNEQTGYFILSPPENGWPVGLHRCGLFVGHEVSAYTHTDEVRFRVIEQRVTS